MCFLEIGTLLKEVLSAIFSGKKDNGNMWFGYKIGQSRNLETYWKSLIMLSKSKLSLNQALWPK